jgi:hypothetical protein
MSLTRVHNRMIEGAAVNVKDFGAVGDGVTDDTAAIEAAWAASKHIYFPEGTYLTSGLTLNGGAGYEQKTIIGNGAEITGDDIYITQMFGLYMRGMKFNPTGSTYLLGVRYADWHNCIFVRSTKWGKAYTGFTQSSWSVYWSKFTQCKFNGSEFTTAITDANFNSNTFDTCEFRAGVETSLMTFKQTATNDPVFSSNTFVGCDMSYAPVLNITVPYSFFAMQIFGGYLDTGTPMYQTGSEKAIDLHVVGLRNPSGVVIDSDITANLNVTTGGARNKNNLPVGIKSHWASKPTSINSFVQTARSFPLPYDGEYTISMNVTVNAGSVDATTFTNTTTAQTVSGALSGDGYSSFTFNASAGDVIQLALDGDATCDADIHFLSLTPGAGVYDAVEVLDIVGNFASGSMTNGVAEDLLTFNIGTYSNQFFNVEVFHRNVDVASGGGEKIVLQVGIATGGSSAAVTVTEVSRTAVNGVGGTSDDAGTVAISTTISGVAVTLVGTLSGTPTDANWKVRYGSGEGA